MGSATAFIVPSGWDSSVGNGFATPSGQDRLQKVPADGSAARFDRRKPDFGHPVGGMNR